MSPGAEYSKLLPSAAAEGFQIHHDGCNKRKGRPT